MELFTNYVNKALPTATDEQATIAKHKATLLRYPSLLDAIINHIYALYFNFELNNSIDIIEILILVFQFLWPS